MPALKFREDPGAEMSGQAPPEVPEHIRMEIEGQTLDELRELADRKRVLGQITPEQERFVLDLLDEAFG
jgi:hypothetical protein